MNLIRCFVNNLMLNCTNGINEIEKFWMYVFSIFNLFIHAFYISLGFYFYLIVVLIQQLNIRTIDRKVIVSYRNHCH